MITVEEVADAVEHLSLSELARLSTTVLDRLPDRGPASRQFQESLLLYAINETISEEKQERYAQLIARRRAEELSEDEYTELLAITQEVEALEARRLELASHLAQLRRVPLQQLISDLTLPQQEV